MTDTLLRSARHSLGAVMLGALALVLVTASAGEAQAAPAATPSSCGTPPPVAREFRGAWLVTVNNGDWPSRPGLSTWEQQQELIVLLDRAVQLGLNAIIFHVRTRGDAFYPTPY